MDRTWCAAGIVAVGELLSIFNILYSQAGASCCAIAFATTSSTWSTPQSLRGYSPLCVSWQPHGFRPIRWLALLKWKGWIIWILLFVAWTYYMNCINYRVALLWRFHRVHHFDSHIGVITVNRFHIREIAM